MYTVDNTSATSTVLTYISTGISEVDFSHRAVMSDNNNAFFEYVYALPGNPDKKVTRTEWEVKQPLPYQEMTQRAQQFFTDRARQFTEWDKTRASRDPKFVAKVYTPETAPQRQYELDVEAQKKRIMYVAQQFVSIEELVGQFKNYFEFIQHVSNKIGGNEIQDSKKPEVTRRQRAEQLRVKFVYAKDGYVNTPSYVKASEPWVERVDLVTQEDSLIRILPNDKMVFEATTGGSRAPQKQNPLSDDSSDKEDLPF